jgi:hypothetical protein
MDRNRSQVTQPASALLAMQEQGARACWSTAAEVLNCMQAFANGWFERRHVGVQAAQEAAERMLKANSPVDWLGEYQKWAAGVLGRITADMAACQQQFRELSAKSPSLVPSSEHGEGEAEKRHPERRVAVKA